MKVAVHLFLIQEQRILLLRRFNTGFMDGKYSVVAGHVEQGEKVVSALIREAKEEAGIVIDEENIQIVQVMHRKSDTERIDYFLTATKWVGDINNMEPNKCDDLSWFHIQELPENMVSYVQFALSQYFENEYFTSFGW